MMQLLDASSMHELPDDPDSPVIIIAPRVWWDKPEERQRRLQLELNRLYAPWHEELKLIFRDGGPDAKNEIDEIDRFIQNWIDKGSDWGLFMDMERNKARCKERIRPLYDLLNVFVTSSERELLLVPDTNSLIALPDPDKYQSVAGQAKYTLILLPTVLAELDRLKAIHRDEGFRKKVEGVIRRIKGWRNQGSLLTGVTAGKTITIRAVAHEPDFNATLRWLDSENADDRIIASALELQRHAPQAVVVLVTGDVNLQNKAEAADLPHAEVP